MAGSAVKDIQGITLCIGDFSKSENGERDSELRELELECFQFGCEVDDVRRHFALRCRIALR